jgi:hypothetical protein
MTFELQQLEQVGKHGNESGRFRSKGACWT